MATSFDGTTVVDASVLREIERSTRYSYGARCAPRCCRFLNRPSWMLFFWCLALFTQGAFMHGSLNAALTTIQERYQLTSTEVGIAATVNDVSTILAVGFVSHYGGRGRRPRWIANGCLLLGISSFVFASPQWLFGSYSYATSLQQPICLPEYNDTRTCDVQGHGHNSYYIFMLAQVLAGIGSTPLQTIGITYLDDNAGPGKSSLFIGVYLTMIVLGPAAGNLLTAASLNVFIDYPLPPKISDDSELWLGAWWIPFIVFGIILILFTFLPILGYPDELPETSLRKLQSQTQKDDMNSATPNNPTSRTVIYKTIQVVVKNKLIWFLALGSAGQMFSASIFAIFGFKLLEELFGVSRAKAAISFGASIVPGAGVGTLLGGLLMKRMKPSIKKVLNWLIIMNVVTTPLLCCFILSCPSSPFAGLQDTYPLQNQNQNQNQNQKQTEQRTSVQNASWVWIEPIPLPALPNLTSACNADCSCSASLFLPVCGSDGVEYYSPCFAGCRTFVNVNNNQQLFFDCKCIKPPESSAQAIEGTLNYRLAFSSTSFAATGKCSAADGQECAMFYVFILLLFLNSFLHAVFGVPKIQVLMRCVEPQHSSFALAFNSFVYRLLGVIPGPIVAGAIFDAYCTFWQQFGCHDESTCLAYDVSNLSYSVMYICLALQVLQVVFCVLARVFYVEKQPDEDPLPVNEVETASKSTAINGLDESSQGSAPVIPIVTIRPRRPTQFDLLT